MNGSVGSVDKLFLGVNAIILCFAASVASAMAEGSCPTTNFKLMNDIDSLPSDAPRLLHYHVNLRKITVLSRLIMPLSSPLAQALRVSIRRYCNCKQACLMNCSCKALLFFGTLLLDIALQYLKSIVLDNE